MKLDTELISVFPNPASSLINIKYKKQLGAHGYVEIYDMYHGKIYEKKFTNNGLSVNIESFPSGMYYFILKSNDLTYFGKFCRN